jgi:hypothetical protein
MHEKAFDARPELKNLLAGEGKAAIEADFTGTRTGEFAGAGAYRPGGPRPLLRYLRPARRSDQHPLASTCL